MLPGSATKPIKIGGPLWNLAWAGLGWAKPGVPTGRTYSVSESSKSDTAGTTLSTGAHAGLTQVRPRCMTACTYLGNNPHQRGCGSASVVDNRHRKDEQQDRAVKELLLTHYQRPYCSYLDAGSMSVCSLEYTLKNCSSRCYRMSFHPLLRCLLQDKGS